MTILAIDIGGSWIKLAAVNEAGELLCLLRRTPTPQPATPSAVLTSLASLAENADACKRVSVAFPGVVRRGRTLTAPNLSPQDWDNFAVAEKIGGLLGAPCRALNDAIVHGLGVATGPGLECIVTFGTGLGFALFQDGKFLVQLELGQHPAPQSQSYDAYVGHGAYLAIGQDAWEQRVRITLNALRRLVNFDRLYVGGGNAQRIQLTLPADVQIAPVTAGLSGGARLWHPDNDYLFPAPFG